MTQDTADRLVALCAVFAILFALSVFVSSCASGPEFEPASTQVAR
jgi:hypothetical protein